MSKLSELMFMHPQGVLMLEAVMIGRVLRSPSEIQSNLEFAWCLSGRPTYVVLYILEIWGCYASG